MTTGGETVKVHVAVFGVEDVVLFDAGDGVASLLLTGIAVHFVEGGIGDFFDADVADAFEGVLVIGAPGRGVVVPDDAEIGLVGDVPLA